MKDFERIITNWDFKGLLDLAYSDIEHHKDIPKNVKELNISGTKLYINYLPSSVKKLIYNEYPYSKVDIMNNNIEYLDLSYGSIDIIVKLPDNLKTLILNYCPSLQTIEKLPDGLETLIITKAEYLKMPKLPNSLKKLIIEECSITSIEKLPDTLENLNCSHNYIQHLPTLPSTLRKLRCSSNQLTALPELPAGLIKLKCSNNKITNIFDLPASLESLNMNNNNVGIILYIPPTLKKLHCESCGLHTLPELPKSLVKLNCANNKLILLPQLPSKLEVLDINNNPITELTIPKKLRVLDISNCKLKGLPKLPSTLDELSCNGIPLKKITQNLESILYLSINNTEIDSLPPLWPNLIQLSCDNNFLTKIPPLPKNLEHLSCSYNRLTKIPKIPASMYGLECSHNLITNLPNLNNMTSLDASYNLLADIPNGSKLSYLNVSYNKITSLQNLPKDLYNLNASFNDITSEEEIKNIPRKVKMVNVEGNPAYKAIKPDIRTPYFAYETRYFKNEKINVTTIPKGTVLFKGYPESSRILSDFTGWFKNDDKYSYIWPNFNVFFYPYPFVVDDINLVGTNITMVTYVLQNDIKVILGVLPSTNSRDDRHKTDYLRTCSTIEVSKHFKGLYYDPCFNPDFMEENKDIIGSIFISGTDAKAHNLVSGKNINLLKYRHFFQDKENHIGVPEIVLYPFKKRYFEEIKFERANSNIYTVLKENMSLYNYRPLAIEPHIASKDSDFKTLVDKLLSPDGAFIDDMQMHLTLDTVTNFFVIAELVDENVLNRCIPISEKDKLKYLK